jgi:TatD DNase family protein
MAGIQSVPGKKFYHDSGNQRFVNLTGRCNLNCQYCPEPMERTQSGDDTLLGPEPSLKELLLVVCSNCSGREIHFTGLGEQTYRLYDILCAGRYLRRNGARVVLNTNGLADRIHNRPVAPDLEDNVDCVNVSLPAINASDYERICRPGIDNAFESVINFIEGMRGYVPEINLAVPAGQPDVDVEGVQKLAKELEIGFQQRKNHSFC